MIRFLSALAPHVAVYAALDHTATATMLRLPTTSDKSARRRDRIFHAALVRSKRSGTLRAAARRCADVLGLVRSCPIAASATGNR